MSHKKIIKEETIVFSVRIVKGHLELLKYYARETGMNFNTFICFIIYNNFPDVSTFNSNFNGVDFKEICELKKQKMLRDMLSFKRNEELSKMYFENRLTQELYKAFSLKVTFENMKKIIDLYYQESCQYKDCGELNKKLQKWRTFEESQYKQLRDEIIKTLPQLPPPEKKKSV